MPGGSLLDWSGSRKGNLRSVIQTAEAIAPRVLWIDEMEKGFAGSRSSGSTEAGTSARVFGLFISWMQEMISPMCSWSPQPTTSPSFRRRCSAKADGMKLFSVDLPQSTDGLTGSEIEQAFVEALYGRGVRPGHPGRGLSQTTWQARLAVKHEKTDDAPIRAAVEKRKEAAPRCLIF